jgi:hypothetical protein
MKLSKKYNLLFFVIPGLILFLFYFYYGSLIGGDTTRYVNAGYKTLEYFGIIFEKPELYDDKISLRAYIQLIPNLIIFFFSKISNNGITYFPVLNIFLFIYIFYYFFKNFFKNFIISKREAYIISLLLFFGFYQIPGWTLKILSETLFIFFSIIYFEEFFFNKRTTKLVILSILLSLIRPQGILFLLFTCIFFFKNQIKKIQIKYVIFIISIFWFILIPFIIHMQLINKDHIFFPLELAYYYAEGNINDGWLYINKDFDFVLNEVRWTNIEVIIPNDDYFFIFFTNLIRTIYSIIPLRFNYSLLINIWFLIYFLTIAIIAIQGLKNIMKNNYSEFKIYFLILLIIMLFNNIMVVDNFRYNLMLIIFIWQLLKFKYQTKKLKRF